MLRILISPEAKSAYFHEYLTVAEQELAATVGEVEISHQRIGGMDFFDVNIEPERIDALLKLSFVQGVFRIVGEQLLPVDQQVDWPLHDDFIFGSKFKGKTNEHLTQLLINVGLANLKKKDNGAIKLFDPMAGRGTTLLWAMRYGIQSWGLEQDAKAFDDVRQIIKKWSKIHRQKHQFKDGFIGKPNRQNKGKFLDWRVEDTNTRFIIGDAREASTLLKEKFDLIVSDIPYGVQHHTTEQTRNPLDVIKESLPGWTDRLKKGGVIVIAFNNYQPKRDAMRDAFEETGLQVADFAVPHRMSESIVRDVIVAIKA